MMKKNQDEIPLEYDSDSEGEEHEHDVRASIDDPVPSKSQFVRRVEETVTLQMCNSTLVHPPLTIPSFFANACQRYRDRAALVSNISSPSILKYWKYYDKALSVARGLMGVGLKPREGVAFMTNNTTKTFCCIMGTILAGGLYVDLYAAYNRSWLIYAMTEARVSVVFVDSTFTKDLQLDIWDELAHMRTIVSLDTVFGQDSRVITVHELLNEGSKISDRQLALRLGKHAPNKCCAIFFRSNEIINQSNTPGVLFSHDNLTIMASLIGEKILRGQLGHLPNIRKKSLKLISFLPITKPLNFVMEILLPMAIGACVYTTNFRPSTVSLWRILVRVRPNIFMATTRIWAHLRNKISEKTRHLSKHRSLVFKYAKRKMLDSVMEGNALPRLSRMIIKEVSKRVGLDETGLFFCFGEALPQNHFEYFLSLNMQIFALREVPYLSGPHAICLCMEDYRTESMGTVFKEFDSKRTRLGKTSAYRMFVRGRHVCMGILHDSITHRVDPEGYLDTDMLTVTIQDDLFFVGTTGEKIILKSGAVLAWEYVEHSFKKLLPIIASCMMVGDNMKTAALLLTLKTRINPETLQVTDVLTQEVQAWCEDKLGSSFYSSEILACSKKLHVVINAALVVINRLIKRSGGWIESYKVLPRDFSTVDNEIDPITRELNRSLILERYRNDLISLYPNA